MNPCVRFRLDQDNRDEFKVAKQHIDTYEYLGDVPENRLVFPRYSALPFYREVEHDLRKRGSVLVNSYAQHRFVADIGQWYPVLEGLTPRTWSWNEFMALPRHEFPRGGVVLKGETNSKKFQWDTHMFAATREAAVQVMCNLQDDGLVGGQPIWVREYVPFKKLADGLHGLPITEEYRVFVLDGRVICAGFYWSSHTADVGHRVDHTRIDSEWLMSVIRRIGDRCQFYVIDVARRDLPWEASPQFTVVELNDGSQAGPSDCNLEQLYVALAQAT